MLTGAYVCEFRDAGIAAIAQILDEDPVPVRERRADVPKDLAKALHQALARDPDVRFRDVGAFRDALLPFAR